ncbi:MAG TPA: DUF3089 domain-containing protein [Rhizomicrobium sp.]|jgi:hypothetical protein
MKRFAALTFATALSIGIAAADTAPAPVLLPKNDYANPANWLCLPGRADDACGRAKEDTTVVEADGTMTVKPFAPDPNAPIDCFYVYPTVSLDPGVVSDMNPGPEEYSVIQAQFARFGAKCRTYAPMYRQFTLTALMARQSGKPMAQTVDPKQNVDDVIDAWNYYLKNYNHGRGVVLIGHSQGSGVLTQMIKSEIDGKPIQKQLISAILMGTRLAVPKDDSGVGGDFKTIPLCKSSTQLGCAIAYASFRDTAPPPADTFFGKVQDPAMKAACVNPTALGGGEGPAETYFGTGGQIVNASTAVEWVKGKPIATAFVSTPGLVTAQCKMDASGVTYLAVIVHGDPKSPRTADIPGDVRVGGQVLPQWGLHLIDAHLFMGNLLDIVGQEGVAYLKANPAH